MAIPLVPLIALGTTLIERIFPNKADQDKAKLEFAVMQQNGDLKEMEVAMSAIVMEAKSADPWTSRARPSFLYVMYFLILFAIPMGILSIFRPDMSAAVATGMKAWLEAIPGELYTLFGAGYLGYAASRTKDKQNVLQAKEKSGILGLFGRD